MSKNIFFDLDGTLIDCSWRLYNLFQELNSASKLSYDEYWEIKRRPTNQKKLLCGMFDFSEDELNKFQSAWMEKVEDKERLATDIVFDEVIEVLGKLQKTNNMYLVTHRQSKIKAEQQAEWLGIAKYFKNFLVTERRISKADLILQTLKVSENDILVTDTGEDIKEGKLLGIKTVAVSSGSLNSGVLAEYFPDKVFKTVGESYQYIS